MGLEKEWSILPVIIHPHCQPASRVAGPLPGPSRSPAPPDSDTLGPRTARPLQVGQGRPASGSQLRPFCDQTCSRWVSFQSSLGSPLWAQEGGNAHFFHAPAYPQSFSLSALNPQGLAQSQHPWQVAPSSQFLSP